MKERQYLSLRQLVSRFALRHLVNSGNNGHKIPTCGSRKERMGTPVSTPGGDPFGAAREGLSAIAVSLDENLLDIDVINNFSLKFAESI